MPLGVCFALYTSRFGISKFFRDSRIHSGFRSLGWPLREDNVYLKKPESQRLVSLLYEDSQDQKNGPPEKGFYLFEREKESRCGEREETSYWAESLTWGSIPGLWDCDLSQRQMLNQLSHLGALNGPFLRRFPRTEKSPNNWWLAFSPGKGIHLGKPIRIMIATKS